MSDDKKELSPEEIAQHNANTNTYPAMFLVDWPNEPVYACNNHAAKLISLGRALGHNIGLHGCGPGHACSNCVNKVKKKEAKNAKNNDTTD